MYLLFFRSWLSSADPPPRVWIFNGLPGDEEHHHFFENNLGEIRKTLLTRFRIPAENITVLYGPKEAGYDGTATRENVLAELKEMLAHAQTEKAAPVWIILHGHANRIPGGANLNLPGPDLSSSALALALKNFPKKTPLVIVATTAAASDFLRALSGPGRIIIAATHHRDPVSETEFPRAFAEALSDPETDADKNGFVTALELFQSCRQRVLKIYEKEGYMVREHAQLDGNGDGKGTQRPAPEDADPAAKIALAIPRKSKFD